MIRVIYLSDFSPSLSREDTQKYLAIDGKTLWRTMDFFQEPFYNKQPSYYLSLDIVILITFFFKNMMKKISSKP
jgi:hypothetical protein